MASSPLELARAVAQESLSDPHNLWAVDFRNVLSLLQLRTIENVTQERYNINAARTVRLLLDKGALDEKQISDSIMMPLRDARMSAFALVTGGIVELQEVPRRPDHHPQFTFYLFRAVSLLDDQMNCF